MRRLQWGIELAPRALRGARMDLHTGELVEVEEHPLGSEALHAFLTRLGGETSLVVSPPTTCVASRFVELPPLKKNLQEGALRSRARKFLDFREDLHSLSFRETTLQAGAERRTGFLVTLVHRGLLDETLRGFSSLGAVVRRIELGHAAVLRWAFWEWPELRRGTRLLALLRRGEVVVVGHSDGSLFFARTFRPALAALPPGPEGGPWGAPPPAPLVDELARDLQACLVHLRFQLCEAEVVPEELGLVGFGPWRGDLEERLGLPVRALEGRRLFTRAGPCDPPEQARWAPCAGLALRALEEAL